MKDDRITCGISRNVVYFSKPSTTRSYVCLGEAKHCTANKTWVKPINILESLILIIMFRHHIFGILSFRFE